MRKTILIFGLLSFIGCNSPNKVQYTSLKKVHVSGCHDNWGKVDTLAQSGQLVSIQWKPGTNRPFCSTWETNTWWDINFHYDDDGMNRGQIFDWAGKSN